MSRGRHRPPELNEQQKAFVREYALTCDLEEAQRRVGYKPHYGNARRILNDPRASKLLREHVKKADELAQVHLAWTLAKFKQLAEANALDVIEIDREKGTFRINLSKLTREQAYAISELGFDSDGRPKLKFHDKTAALKALQGYLTPEKPQRLRLEGTGEGGAVEVILGLGDRLNAARARIREQRVLPAPEQSAA